MTDKNPAREPGRRVRTKPVLSKVIQKACQARIWAIKEDHWRMSQVYAR